MISERERRRGVVDQARHHSEMEGARSTEEVRAAQEAYVPGEITVQELIAIAKGWAPCEHARWLSGRCPTPPIR